MKAQRLLPALMILGLLGACANRSWAQQSDYQRKVEEYNAYVDTTRAQDRQQRLNAIESFLENYPESQYRPFVYQPYVQTAFELKQYSTVMKAANEFWAMDREKVAKAYQETNPQITDLQIDEIYYAAAVLYTYSFLQNLMEGKPLSDDMMADAVEPARRGLALHDRLYSQVPPPSDEAQRKQFLAKKHQHAGAFHSVLALAAWRKKDYPTAAREYATLVEFTPEDPLTNYRLGSALLQKKPPEYLKGFWHLARASGLNTQKSGDLREYLTNAVATYQQALPECVTDQVNDLIAKASQSVHPPPGWSIVAGDQVITVRQELTSVKRIFDGLQAGGETAQLMWLASCGTEMGLGEDGKPALPVMVLEVNEAEDNLVTMLVAAGQEAVDAKKANVEVKVEGPPEASKLRAKDVVRISGKLSGLQTEPDFILKLTEGRVNPEDIPKTRR